MAPSPELAAAVYPKYFGLKEPSFSIAPDPHYLYLSEQHREALAHLLYGACESGGFVLLTGEVGTGKTTVCRAFLEQLPQGVDVALILNPAMTAEELMQSICDELGIAVPDDERSVKRLVDLLNRYLLDAHARGRRTVLMIDEAQNLRPKVMEQVRLLTNLETTKHKLLQIFLVGQPELRRMLERDSLRQINQRITARFHLRPLSASETGDYIRHRVAVAGVDRPLFNATAVRRIHQFSGGIPRLINILCDRALLGACVTRASQVTPSIVARAAREVRGDSIEPISARRGVRPSLSAAAVLALAVAAGWLGFGALKGDPAQRIVDLIEPLGSKGKPLGPPKIRLQSPTKSVAATGPALAKDPSAGDDPMPRPAAAQGAAAAAAGAAGVSSQEKPPVAVTASPQIVVAVPAPPPPAPVAAPPESAVEVAGVPAVAAVSAPAATPTIPAQIPGPEVLPRVSLASFGAETTAETLDRLAMPLPKAMAVLLRRWGLTAPDLGSGDPCPRIEPLGMRCEPERGRLSHVRFFDRPVLLRVADRNGQARWLALGALDESEGIFDTDSGSEPVSFSGIESVWTGDYIVVWQAPPTGATLIGPGASGDSVRWLRRLLSQVPGSGVAYTDSGRFDATLSGAVREFQAARGLATDGIAGPRTLIEVGNAAAVAGIPHLRKTIPSAQAGAQSDADARQGTP